MEYPEYQLELVQWEDASCNVRGIPDFWLTAMKNHDDIQVLAVPPRPSAPEYPVLNCTLRFSLLFFITREPPSALHALAPDQPRAFISPAHAMRTCEHGFCAPVQAQIAEKDEPALKFVTNITTELIAGEEQGFKLTFEFAENPFFTNKILEKR